MTDTSRLLPMAPADARPPIFERIAIVGLGLIGASIAYAARRAWPSALVIGVDRGAALEQAVARRAVDVASHDPLIASEADLVILATPVGQIVALLPRLSAYIGTNAVITDVGSTKAAIVEVAGQLPARLTFVGGHPLAGSTASGIDGARPDLFDGRPWVLVGDEVRHAEAFGRLRAFVEGLGARPLVMATAAEHDRLVARLSHLPQLAASCLMHVVGEEVGAESLSLAASGLVDTTRLAASPASIWRDVCATNHVEIGAALDRLIAELQTARAGLQDPDVIDRLFASATLWRERLVDASSDES